MTNRWRQGLVNGAPYLCSALIGCWTTKPLNHYFGRRGCIFICCFISFASSFWMAAAHTWWNLLLGRFLLGFAVGAKSTTTPVYGAECSPAIIRGALVMMWQVCLSERVPYPKLIPHRCGLPLESCLDILRLWPSWMLPILQSLVLTGD